MPVTFPPVVCFLHMQDELERQLLEVDSRLRLTFLEPAASDLNPRRLLSTCCRTSWNVSC